MARKILLADDSVTAQNMGRKILADAGYEVITVNNGSAALKKIAEIKPDLIVLDVYMPGYSGLEVCQRLKEAGDTARIPVLLTVGKLEPFKPEEAKRVCAEGFIVKPFEASELLSALTKLEDKMVPRSESSKPGRFARTIAAVEEGRYDKTVAPDEDSGWKNRIAFPSKKKDKAAEAEESDDSAIYNPVNKDLRTVVEQKPTQAPQATKATEAKTEDNRVDLTAVAPEGLPKDVTPEEIAALAAAAAQMQGKIADASVPDAKSGDTKIPEIKAAEAAPEQSTGATQVPSHESSKVETKAETREMGEPAAIEAATVGSAPQPAPATFAEQKPEEKKYEASAEKPSDETPSVASIVGPTNADVTAAITALEKSAAPTVLSSSSSQESSEHERHHESEPVTMAMAAATAAQSTAAPRWTAVAVALAPEESGIALEDEMRKAYAAYAAAETDPAQAVAPISDTSAAQSVSSAQVPAPAESEAPSITSTAGAIVEEVSTRVKSFETVRASSAEAQPAVSAETAPVKTSESTASEREAAQAVETSSIEARAGEASAAPVAPEPPVAEITSPMPAEQKSEEPAPAKEDEHDEELVAAAAFEQAPVISAQAPETAKAAPSDEVAAASSAAPEPAVSAALAESVCETPREAPHKESDIAATTAAAWASWRRIRESGDPKDASHKGEDQPAGSRDEAAMAVAAGAEKAPEEGPEIASIVDSVLADLRPKIVEEISRKLKKK